MKKFVSIVAFLALFSVQVALAANRKATVPESQHGNAVESFDYAGVDFATATLTRSTTTLQIFTGEGVLYGFIASSNPASSDFVLFRATNNVTGTTDALSNAEAFRIHLQTHTLVINNLGTDTGLAANVGSRVMFDPPIYFKNGCTGRVVMTGDTVLNSIAYLFNKFGKPD